MIEVELPDGTIAEFPEGTSPDIIQSTLRKQLNIAPQQPEQPIRNTNALDAGAGLVAQGLQGSLANFGDEIIAAPAAALNMGVNAVRGRDVGTFSENYDTMRGEAKDLLERTDESYPNLSIAANLGGAVASPLARVGGGATNAMGALGRGAGIGALYGLGAGEGIEDRLLEAGKQGALGGALGYGGAKILDSIGPSKYTEKVGNALTTARQAAYDLVDSSKAAIGKNAVRNFVSDARTNLTRQGFVPSEHKGIARALKDFESTPQKEMTSARVDAFMKRMDTLRDGQEGLAGMLKRQVGDFVGDIQPNQMAYGGTEGATAIRDARKLYAKEMRDKAIDDAFKAVDRRGRSVQEQTSFDNEFRKLANDEMFMRGLPDKAKKAIEGMAEPGVVDRTLYRAAGLSPFSGGRLGAGLAAMGVGGAVATGNPLLLAPQAVGVVSDVAQRARQKYGAELARDMVKNMGNDVLTYEQRLRMMNK